MNRIVIASNNPVIEKTIEKMGICNVLKCANTLEDASRVAIETKAEMMFICDIKGDVYKTCKDVKSYSPDTRIIYVAGELNKDDVAMAGLISDLVQLGVYDICLDATLKKSTLRELLTTTKTYSDMAKYIIIKEIYESDVNPYIDEDGAKNVVIFSSIKPGSGKSFISTNIATAIAKFAKEKKNGEKPKVAIIEGDLQSLSVGTLLQIENPTFNLRTALLEVSRVVNKAGDLVGTEKDQRDVEQRVLDCFNQFNEIPNLYALVGSQLSLRDLHEINSYQYYYLISILVKHFDVIIVDTNSSLEHITTGPLLELAKACYYILDLDINNIRNNIRYRDDLNELCRGKVRYILNRDMPKEKGAKYTEELKYGSDDLVASGFNLAARIPMVDLTVMYNHVYNGHPLILDDKPSTLRAREELLTIASQICPLKDEAFAKKKTKKR